MNKDVILQGLSAKIANLAFKLEQNGPQIGFWGGLGLLLSGSGLAVYRACTKVPEIKKEAEHEIALTAAKRLGDEIEPRELELQIAQVKRVEKRRYLKTFVLPAGMVIAGAAAQSFGFIKLDQRYRKAGADLAAITAAFAAYRKRMADRLGEDEERALYYGAELREITDEDGNTHTVMVSNGETVRDPYTYEFSADTTDACDANDDMHEMILKMLYDRQQEWDKILQNDPVVWLDSVLASLGLSDPENFAARRAGWLNPKWYDTPGEGHIDFRVTPMRYIASDGVERWKYMLNFNCDGDVLAMAINQRGLLGQKIKQWEV